MQEEQTLCVCVCVCVCVYIYIYIHTHTHTHTQLTAVTHHIIPWWQRQRVPLKCQTTAQFWHDWQAEILLNTRLFLLIFNSVYCPGDSTTKQQMKIQHSTCKIPGSHGNKHEEDYLLGCSAMYCGRNWPTFQRCLQTPSLVQWVNKHLWNINQFLPDYTAHPRRQ
jgi:hypothetical protein